MDVFEDTLLEASTRKEKNCSNWVFSFWRWTQHSTNFDWFSASSWCGTDLCNLGHHHVLKSKKDPHSVIVSPSVKTGILKFTSIFTLKYQASGRRSSKASSGRRFELHIWSKLLLWVLSGPPHHGKRYLITLKRRWLRLKKTSGWKNPCAVHSFANQKEWTSNNCNLWQQQASIEMGASVRAFVIKESHIVSLRPCM